MGTHFIPNDDDSIITGVVTDIKVDCEKIKDIRKCFGDQEAFSKMYEEVHRTLLLQGLSNTLRSEVENECFQNVFYYITTYLGAKLRNKKYERMLKNEIPVYDLRRVAKLPEENQRLLDYFGYSYIGIPYRKQLIFVYGTRDDIPYSYIVIYPGLRIKNIGSMRFVLYHEYKHYLQWMNNECMTEGDDAHRGKGDRSEHQADWYAAKRMWAEGYSEEVLKHIDFMRKQYEKCPSSPVVADFKYRSELLRRAYRRYISTISKKYPASVILLRSLYE